MENIETENISNINTENSHNETKEFLSFERKRKFLKKVLSFLFRIKVEGLENLEQAGNKALIIPNHTSYLDGLVIALFVNRKITFSITDKLANKWWMKIFTFLTDSKFLDPDSPLSIKSMVNELNHDKTCMIFTDSNMFGSTSNMKIYEPAALMAQKADAPVIPVQILGLKHSAYSRLKRKSWLNIFPRVTVKFNPAVKLDDDSYISNKQVFDKDDNADKKSKTKQKTETFKSIREKCSSKLHDILADLKYDAIDKNKTVIDTILNTMHLVGGHKEMLEDISRKVITFREMFMKSFILGRYLSNRSDDTEVIGIVIPTSSACVMSVLGLQLYGKIPAMLNFTSSPMQVVSCCKTAGIKVVATAHKVVEGAHLEGLMETLTQNGIQVLYLEDMKQQLSIFDKLAGILGYLFPKTMYKLTSDNPDPEDPAVILFTSGTEGMPKGVVLSHKNIVSNVWQISTKFDTIERDIILNCLPMFHSFGMTAGTLMPLILGFKIAAYPSPLHYKVIPGFCSSVQATIFFATDTFLINYAKYATPYDFNSVRILAAGAEKINQSTKDLWLNKFGIRILEGYGATECSPIISINNLLYKKRDSVGRMMPGMEYKLRKIDGIKDGRELMLRGPNIMRGYLDGKGGITEISDGWYATGDIAEVDEEGFIFLKGRYKRFAKIAGEMVSLLAVEMIIRRKFGEYINGVISVPDDKKGEQLVLITNCKDISKSDLLEMFDGTEIPKLAMPKEILYTPEPPLLNTGKFDYVRAQDFVMEKLGLK